MITAHDSSCKPPVDCRLATLIRRFLRLPVQAVVRGRVFIDRCTPPVAFDVEFEDAGVMNPAVDRGECHGGVGEDGVPLAEGLIGGNQD
jgi:hypothetical protein